MQSKIKNGTCGFGLAQDTYTQMFNCVEVQQTFYQPPKILTLEKWRHQAPRAFEFTLKAWQLMTHDARSPTYRRLKRKLSAVEAADAGYFRPTSIVREAWKVTRECATALNATFVLFQCPASFTEGSENISNLEKFFSTIDRGKLVLGWEPRGDWDDDIVKSICADLKLCHVVDPFVTKTVTPRKCYFRLHGRGGWRYEYDESELRELAKMLPQSRSAHVFFNNARMTKDAASFQEIINERE